MYHSPFHLIDPAVFEAGLDAAALKRRLGLEKKKLLAEFELADSPTITINGRDLQRQDLNDLFDELQDLERLRMHLLLWEQRSLLHFLETGETGGAGEWAYPAEGPGGEAIVSFVSPYYAAALNRYLQRCLLGEADPRSLLYELRAEDWLQATDMEEAYRYPARFFTEKKNELISIRYRSENGESLLPEEIRGWCNDMQIHVLNRLPDHFDHLRYTLAERLNNLCVLYDRKQEKHKALAAIERAATIRVNDEELERLVPSNLRIIRNKSSNSLVQVDPNTGKRRPKLWLFIVLALIAFRILSTGAGCRDWNRQDRDELRQRPSITSPERSAEEQSFHSLIRALTTVPPQAPGMADSMLRDVVRLSAPFRTGTDPFAALFRNMQTQQGDAAALATGDSSSALMQNNTPLQAIFLFQYAGAAQQGVYVAPGETFLLRYPNVGMTMHLYAGTDWSDTLGNSFYNFRTQGFAPRQAFRGGFRTVVPLSNEESVDGTPMFSREAEETGSRDTFTLTREPQGELVMRYNLGAY